MRRRIVLLGPPASGKGTQADRLSIEFGIPHVSTGALLRAECAQGTPLGREADEWTSRGLLVPDDLAVRIVASWMNVHGASFLLDGFPRTIRQAQYLDDSLTVLSAPLDLVVLLDLSEDEIRRRILARISCLGCGATFSAALHGVTPGQRCPNCGETLVRRKDDCEEAIGERLRVYRESTLPVADYYGKAVPNIFHHIDAGEGSDEIFAKLSALVRQEIQKTK